MYRKNGVLWLGTDVDQLLLACVGGADKVFDGEDVVMVATGHGGEDVVMVVTGNKGLVRTKIFFRVVSICRST